MRDWLVLLHAPRFRAFWLALLCNGVGSWCVLATLPILVAERFGAGMELVLSLGLRVVPKLLLAPLASRLFGRFGSARVASAGMLAMAALTALLPWCRTFAALQVVVAAIGALDLFVVPGLLALRGPVTPVGTEMVGNTLCSVADRSAKVAGSAVGGLAVAAGLDAAFAGFAVLMAAAAVPVARLSRAVPVSTRRHGPVMSLRTFLRLIRDDRQITGLLVAALTYMVLLGGLRPFLFWANRDWFAGADSAWTGLLAAQGVGALIGAVVSALAVPWLLCRMSAYTLSIATGVIEGAMHLLFLATVTNGQAMVVLALAGIPEIISTAAWFTVIQLRLTAEQQGAFYSFVAPLWDVFFALGIASAGLYAGGLLSLSAYWAAVALFATLPVVPFLRAREPVRIR